MSFSLSGKREEVVRVNGNEYGLNLSFQRVMRALEVIEEPFLSDADKVGLLFAIFIKNPKQYDIDLIEGAAVVEAIFSTLTPKDEDSRESGTLPIFDWKEDGERIYASFLEFYNIDLLEENLSWSKFNALFNNLGPDTPIMQAIKYRGMKVPKGKHLKEEREHVLRMKQFYALESNKERIAELQGQQMAALFNL